MNTYHVDIYGPPGSGKTVVLAGLYLYLTKYSKPAGKAAAPTPGLLDQVDRLNRLEFNTHTVVYYRDAASGSSPGGPSHTVDPHREERVKFLLEDPSEMVLTSHAGEELISGRGFNTATLLEQFQNDESRILVTVLNPFLCNEELARDAMRNLIATLQARRDLRLKDALHLAATLLFHWDLWGGAQADSKAPEKRSGRNKEVYENFQDDFNALPVEAKITWDHAENSFVVLPVVPGKKGQNKTEIALDTMLERVTNAVVGAGNKYIDAIKPVVQALRERTLVVLSHIDLLDLIPTVLPHRLDPVYDRIFGEAGDRRSSQQVLGRNMNLFIPEQNSSTSIRMSKFDTGSAERLFEAIQIHYRRGLSSVRERAPAEEERVPAEEGAAGPLARLLEAHVLALKEREQSDKKKVVAAEDEEVTVAELGKEAVYHWFYLSPLAVAVALLGAWWFAPGFGEVWKWVGGTLLGLLALALGLVWLRARWLPPRWRVEEGGDGVRRLVVRRPTGRAAELAADQAGYHSSWLGQILDVGWLTAGGNRLRRFPAPQLRRLMNVFPARRHAESFHDVVPALGLVVALLVGVASLFNLMRAPGDPFTLTPDDAEVQIVAGTSARVPVSVERTGRFAGPVLLWARSQPEGPEVEPVFVKPDAQRAELHVTLPATAADRVSYSLQVIGTTNPADGPARNVSSKFVHLRVASVDTLFTLSPEALQEETFRGGKVDIQVKVIRRGAFAERVTLLPHNVQEGGPFNTAGVSREVPPKETEQLLTLPVRPSAKPGPYQLQIQGVTQWRGKVVASPRSEAISVNVEDPFKLHVEGPDKMSAKIKENVKITIAAIPQAGFDGRVRITATSPDSPDYKAEHPVEKGSLTFDVPIPHTAVDKYRVEFKGTTETGTQFPVEVRGPTVTIKVDK